MIENEVLWLAIVSGAPGEHPDFLRVFFTKESATQFLERTKRSMSRFYKSLSLRTYGVLAEWDLVSDDSDESQDANLLRCVHGKLRNDPCSTCQGEHTPELAVASEQQRAILEKVFSTIYARISVLRRSMKDSNVTMLRERVLELQDLVRELRAPSQEIAVVEADEESRGPRLPVQDSARDMWLLATPPSGQMVVPATQYEELRALAVKLAGRVDRHVKTTEGV